MQKWALAVVVVPLLTLSGCNQQTGFYQGKVFSTDEKASVYALTQQIRSGATDDQLAHPFVHVTSNNGHGFDVVEYVVTDAHGNKRTVLTGGVGANPDNGEIILPADANHFKDMEDLTPLSDKMLNSALHAELGLANSADWTLLKDSRTKATLDGVYQGQSVRVDLLSGDFDFVYNADPTKRTAKIDRARVAVVWPQGGAAPLSLHEQSTLYDYDTNGNPVNPHPGMVPLPVLIFVGVGYGNPFPFHDAAKKSMAVATAHDAEQAIKDYPKLLAEAKKQAGM